MGNVRIPESPYSQGDGFRKYRRGERVMRGGWNCLVTYADGSRETLRLDQTMMDLLTANGSKVEIAPNPRAELWQRAVGCGGDDERD